MQIVKCKSLNVSET